MLSCDYCTALAGCNVATVDPHIYLVSGRAIKLFDHEIKSYQCSICGLEWGFVETDGVPNGHWIRRAKECPGT
jgi:hypothetical protein